GFLVWQEGGEAVAALLAAGAVAMGSLVYWLVRRRRAGKPTLINPELFRSKLFRFGVSGQMLQQIALGGMMIALPIYLQMVLEYNALESGLSLAPLSLSMFAMALVAGKRAGKRRPAGIIRLGFLLLTAGVAVLLPIVPRATSGWYLAVPLVIAGLGLGLLVSQLNNYTLSPLAEESVSEGAGVNSAAGSFGLSFGLAFAGAIMLATLSFTFTNMAHDSTVLSPRQRDTVAHALESGLSLAPLSLSMFAIALLAGRRAGTRRPSSIIRAGFTLLSIGVAALILVVPRADSGLWLALPLLVAGCGLGLLVSQLNNYTLSPIDEERISEAAGVNSAGGSFGLSFGLAFAGGIMLATLAFAFTAMVEASSVIPPDQKETVSTVLEDDAQLMSNTQLEALLVNEPPAVSAEIIRINTDARPLALQAALLVPLIAGLLGLANGFRMMRLPDPAPSTAAEGMVLG
ncbi:MAG: MFS transporter, partial [Chloroflexota bacterium]